MTVVLEATVAERVAQALEFMDQAEAESRWATPGRPPRSSMERRSRLS